MIERYDFKLIKSGRQIEVYDYKTKKIIRGYKKAKNQEQKKIKKQRMEKILEMIGSLEQLDFYEYKKEIKEEKENQALKTRFSISRTRTNIRRITNANPRLDKFLTLTFAQSMPDLKQANYLFNQAIKRIIRSLPDFEYIAVVEFQKDIDYYGKPKPQGGSVHYHLLCNIEMTENKSISNIFNWEKHFALKYWKNGFIKIKDIEQVNNIGAYFCKYLSKDMFDKRMFGKKKFFCSQTLNKPVELTGHDAIYFFDKYVSSTKPIFQKTFSSEYSGIVDYSAYSLKEDLPFNLNIMTAKKENKNVFTKRKTCY